MEGRPSTPPKTEDVKQTYINTQVNSKQELSPNFNVATFNCKNILTAGIAIKDLAERMDIPIILLQEHWLFDTQLDSLNYIHDEYMGTGKSVDSDDPITPAQMP